MRASFLTLLLVLFSSLALAEAPQIFILNLAESSVQFQIDSPMMPITGTIERYSGRLVKTGKLFNQFEIFLDCELASTKITGEQLQGLSIGELMASVKNSTAHFEGKPVSQKSDGTLNIGGTLKWRGKSYTVSFPLQLKQEGKNLIALQGKIRGNTTNLLEELPMLSLFQIQSASAAAKLVFIKSSGSFNGLAS